VLRRAELGQWYASVSGGPVELQLAAGDASFRRYYRARPADGAHHAAASASSGTRGAAPPGSAVAGSSLILCDAPPATEKNREFVAIARALAEAGVRVPRVLAADYERGFLALEDLGDRTLLPELTDSNVEAHYGRALAMLEALAAMDARTLGLPTYDRQRLGDEMALCPTWFCEGLLDMALSDADQRRFAALAQVLSDRALAQPQVLVHRDFHARNLMLLPGDELATIDFQDAVIGPVTYDPVSLLRDCYRRWPAADVRRWALRHRAALAARGVPVSAAEPFLVDFDWMGLQRHLKVLGIFARLHQRDGKSAYLHDLPRVIAYVREVLAAYPEDRVLADFATWFDAEVVPRARTQSWFVAA
jgi:aminoglycoside/choline kinase family phosphotransferase